MVILAGNPEQEIGEVRAGFSSEEEKAAVELRNGVDVHLIVVKLAAELQRVRADHFRKIIEPLKGVADLIQLVGIRPDSKAVEPTLSTPSVFGESGTIPGVPGPTSKPCEARLTPNSADRFAQVVGVAQIAEVEFVHGGRADAFCVAQIEQLRAAQYRAR